MILLVGAWPAVAAVRVQCPATIIDNVTGQTSDPNVVCKHLIAGDGFINMADKSLLPAGRSQYIFGFADVTGQPEDQVMMIGMLGAGFSAPTLSVKQGQDLYLTLTNVGMIMRPDLFDPHSVHYHGFPNAAPIFDGVPESSVAAIPGASFTYYYKNVDAGTYLYHCHVEATEHMQMGMLGNLYVRPAQDGTPIADPDGSGRTHSLFAYDDGDGSTGYDVDFPIQVVAFDSLFHELHIGVQPLPFAAMDDNYPMFNGRGYPDTTIPGSLPPPVDNDNAAIGVGPSQNTSSLIQATAGQKILLRMSSLSTTSFHTIEVLGIPMTVVGKDAKLLRGPSPDGGTTPGKNVYYQANSVHLGGGQSADVLLDTQGVAPGTYFVYARELNHLNNWKERFGGMMTEIRIAP
jgi:FtsP/CotA-like multicopper oxidase with cupredoxin domain